MMTGIREQALIRRLQKRDERAFQEIVRLYQHKVWNLVFRMIGSREEAEDIWAEAESLRALGRAADDASARSNASDSRSAPDLTLGQTDKRPGDPA